ncbi:MAG: 6-bladed beta-propeller [Candidatus Aminicenantales bacterium]
MRRLGLVALAVVLAASTDCRRHEESFASPLSKSEVQAISSAKTAAEIFDVPREVQLETKAECAVAEISDLGLDANGNFIIADGWQLRQVFVFASDGRFVKILGRLGQGPGEYSTPVSVAVNSEGEILIADYQRNQIIVFDRDYQFQRSLPGKPRIQYFVHVNARDEIYTYSGTVSPRRHEVFNSVHKLDKDGAEVLSFAPVPQAALDMNFSAVNDGMTIDEDDFVYEMNPLHYQVRKFSAGGKLIGSFTNPHYHNERREGEPPTILNGPHYLERGLIVVQRGNVIDIFDTLGNFLTGDIPFSLKIITARRNTLYCVQWDETVPQKTQPNPKVICFELRSFAR